MPTQPSKELETFLNPHTDRDYIIEIEAPEFTCLCPKTGQPDFATILLEYVPDKRCIELKSLKLYYWAYRDEGAFHEDVANTILNDLVAAVMPRHMRLRAMFNVRGGIYTTVDVSYTKTGWTPPPPPPDYLPRVKQELPGRNGETAKTEAVVLPADNSQQPAKQESRTGQRFRMLRRSKKTLIPEEQPSKKPQAEKPKPPPKPSEADPIFIGIDIGTTGCRLIAIDKTEKILAKAEAPIPAPRISDNQITQDAALWWKACRSGLQQLTGQLEMARVRSIVVDGTSGTVLLCDKNGVPSIPAMMYNDQRAVDQVERINEHASADAAVHNASSSLAKLLWLQDKKLDKKATHFLHQADWIVGKLSGQWGHSDYNNCLKLGFDSVGEQWPNWLGSLDINLELLPQVHTPGTPIGPIDAKLAKKLGLPADTEILAGSTDGVAGVLAAGATEPGHGVTSLGTTLVIKLLSEQPIFAPEHGVYSHRLGKYWLAGGASNSGGAVLLQYFKLDQMEEMTPMLDPDTPTGLDYYPLSGVGERFPINDPDMAPKLEPLPGNSVNFFQGILEGIANIEAQGYSLLAELDGPTCSQIFTTGGGSRNPAWERIRANTLGVPLVKPRSTEAAFGAALLAAGVVEKNFS